MFSVYFQQTCTYGHCLPPDQDTALHVAAMCGHSNMVSLLMDEPSTTFTRNKDDLHFLDLAIKNDNKEVVVCIISHDRLETPSHSLTIISLPLTTFSQQILKALV